MVKEFVEPEERELNNTNTSEGEIIDDFNPLDEPVIEKAYTRHNVRMNPKDMASDIPEPSFTPPPMSQPLTEEQKTKKPEEPFNPQLKELPKKDKHDAAEKVAKMIMGAYKWGNDFADKKLLFDEKKIMKLQQEGEIDLSVEVPISPSASVSAGEFIQEYNDQSKGTISVSSQFEEETMPVLTRVLEKKGVGMTDENYLIYLFGKDMLVKGFMVQQSLSVKKEMLNMLKEATMTKNQFVQSTPNPQQPQQQYSQPQQQYSPTPTYQEPSFNSPNMNDFTNDVSNTNSNNDDGYMDYDYDDFPIYEKEGEEEVKNDDRDFFKQMQEENEKSSTNDNKQTKVEIVDDIEEPKYQNPTIMIGSEPVVKSESKPSSKKSKGRPKKNKS